MTSPAFIRAVPDDLCVRQAIDWMVRLNSGVATEADVAACCDWRAAHSDHDQAWLRLEALGNRVHSLPAEIAHATLGDSPSRKKYNRRFTLKTLGVLLGAGTLAVVGKSVAPWQTLLAAYSTGIGQQRRVTLADGTVIQLNTHTALDAEYDDTYRRIRLYRGELLIATAPDPSARHRPFIVQTRLGNIRALGTQFRVQQRERSMLVAVFEGAVEVQTPQGHGAVRIDAGQQAVFEAGAAVTQQAVAIAQADSDAIAWTDGMIVANKMRLGDLIAEMDRYVPGRIRCEDSVANLRISGVFPIQAPEKILAAIGRTLPVRIDMFTGYWITLRPAE